MLDVLSQGVHSQMEQGSVQRSVEVICNQFLSQGVKGGIDAGSEIQLPKV